jgi:UDP-N-acetyl-D-mannosaminuronic acid dehydrogenase
VTSFPTDSVKNLKELILKFKQVCVLGLGYIGLPTASTLATHGLRVAGVDINLRVLNTLRNGDLHIHEPGLRTLVQAAFGSGNLTVSEQPSAADVFIIAVPTPFDTHKRADLGAVTTAAEMIVPHLRKGNLVILESTSPPRTTVDILAPILEKAGLQAGEDFHLVYSAERVLPGQILRELIENARVIGGINTASAKAGRDLYKSFVRGEIILTDATTAEMVKLMENTYRDINIAIANEFARLADKFDIDVWEAIRFANRHPRVEILRPGPGVGGHCIGVDPWFLVETAPDLTPLIRTARQVNDAQPGFVVDLVRRVVGELKGCRVAALGLAYKADVDDLRESPAIEVAQLLAKAGASVAAYEPLKEGVEVPGVNVTTTLQDSLSKSDVILLLVSHSSLTGIDPQVVAELTQSRDVVDTVNGLPASAWEAAGFRVHRLGVGPGYTK